MTGKITKKHFFQIAKEFGIKLAVKTLFSNKGTFLEILMAG